MNGGGVRPSKKPQDGNKTARRAPKRTLLMSYPHSYQRSIRGRSERQTRRGKSSGQVRHDAEPPIGTHRHRLRKCSSSMRGRANDTTQFLCRCAHKELDSRNSHLIEECQTPPRSLGNSGSSHNPDKANRWGEDYRYTTATVRGTAPKSLVH